MTDWLDDSDMPGDFCEDDEPVEDVLAAFDRGEKGLTHDGRRWVSRDGLVRLVVGGCRLVRRPVFAGQPMLPDHGGTW